MKWILRGPTTQGQNGGGMEEMIPRINILVPNVSRNTPHNTVRRRYGPQKKWSLITCISFSEKLWALEKAVVIYCYP
jgi:hypothetical protein